MEFTLPAGSIVAYAALPKTLPANWVECDGSSYSTTAYPDLFQTLGYANGGAGPVFKLPDLRGRFIRGRSHLRHTIRLVPVTYYLIGDTPKNSSMAPGVNGPIAPGTVA